MLRRALNLKTVLNLKRYCGTSSSLTEWNIDQNGYAILRMKRRPVNALNYELLTELCDNFTNFEKQNIKGLILTSNAARVFSAGVDLYEIYNPNEKRLSKFWGRLQETWIKIYGSSFPTVAIINGNSPAGGCFLGISCDYRIMLNDYKIGLNEVLVGIKVPFWLSHTMKTVINPRRGEFACTTGKLYTTNEAFEIGLIDEIAESNEDGMERALRFLNLFEKVSFDSRKLTKLSIRGEIIKELETNWEINIQKFVQLLSDKHVQENIGTYLNKIKKS